MLNLNSRMENDLSLLFQTELSSSFQRLEVGKRNQNDFSVNRLRRVVFQGGKGLKEPDRRLCFTIKDPKVLEES